MQNIEPSDQENVMRPETVGGFWDVSFMRRKGGEHLTDQDYMRRAIELAKQGLGYTNPNPMVGAVIVKDDKIIGEGYHARCGGLHAERSALEALTESAEGATIYVTLEPCCHFGKQPPCTQAILDHKIKRVVIGSRDPNPLVAGKGVTYLREAGVIVEEDVLREECDALNPVFFHYITKKTPYVVLKYAMTADGKIATRTGASKWITGEAARNRVQHMRHRYMGIMAGIGTVLADDPMLNVRIEGLKSPIRIICDSGLRIPLESQIVQTAKEYQTIVAYAQGDPKKQQQLIAKGIQLEQVEAADGQLDLRQLMVRLGELGIDSVLVEGGGTLNDSLVRAGLVDQMEVFVAPKIFGGSAAKTPVEGVGIETPAEAVQFHLTGTEPIGDDVLLCYMRG